MFLPVSVGGLLLGVSLFANPAWSADAPSVEYAMKIPPRNNDVEYDSPDPKTYKQCKVVSVNEGKMSGWLIVGPGGQPLRKFMDTNDDGVVDQLSYFRAGLEVYRDIDTNFNNKIDQSRWMNLGGTRWGVDSNEDGKIDSWKMISPDEVSRVAVKALVSQDVSLLTPLLITKADLAELGIKGPLETKLLASVSDPAARLKKSATGSKVINAKTTWMKFDAAPPGVIPAETYKTPADLYVYENAMAIVDSGNPQQPGLINLGELVRIGDVWKLTIIPHPLDANAELAPGIVMFHAAGAGAADATQNSTPEVSDEMRELVAELEKVMKAPPAPNAGKPAFEKYYKQVENALIKLVNASKTDEDRAQWTRQLLDQVAAAVQSGNYPSGVARLKQLETEITKASPKSPLVPVAKYRAMLAQYANSMQEADSNEARQKIHETWLKNLEDFLDENPKADDAADAGLQLAVALEFGGKIDKAKKWYQHVSTEFGESPSGSRAAGALRRIELTGKPLTLTGAALAGGGTVDLKQFKGKNVLVFFWDTRSKLCLEDLPQIKTLYEEYRSKGFEVIGINLDVVKDEVGPYLSQHQVRWPQIFEPGGLESAPARTFGIISLPTMFLVDGDGKVINRNATVADVKTYLQEAIAATAKK